MITKFSRALPACRTGLLLLAASGAGLLTVSAQQTSKPADGPKPPVHKPDQSALNRLKQDDRSKQELIDAGKKILDGVRRNDAAEKELRRLDTKSVKDDPAAAVDAVKDKLTPGDEAALKVLQDKAKDVLNDPEVKRAIEEQKKKAAASVKSGTAAPTTTPPARFGPSTFDQVPAPVPATGPVHEIPRQDPNFVVTGDSVVFPPSSDPDNPQRALPPSDPRSRTYVVTGNGQVKSPSMVLEGDRIIMVASQDGEGAGFGGMTAQPSSKSKPKGRALDPVQPGINADAAEKKATPFDRVIATGRVNIVRVVDGKTQTGKGGSMIYDKKSGTMVLTDWPQAQLEGRVITGRSKEAKIILVPDGEPRVENCRIEGFDEAKSRQTTASGPAPVPPKARPVP